MNPKCLICGSLSDFLMKKDGFDEYLCPVCGLSFVWPQPSAEWLKDEIYSYESGYQANKRADLSLTKEDKRVAKTLNYLLGKHQGGRLLDVGSSSGQFLYSARKRGMQGKGVEINKRTADIAKANGFEVHNGFLETAPFERGSFDIVYLGDVIEHVNDPRAFVRLAGEFLKKGGTMCISTPNMDCFWSKATLWLHRLFKIPWAPATPPHHLSQFSLGNLNRLLAEEGFMHSKSIFFPPSSLRYELGSLHLYGRWKRSKTAKNLLFMIFSFGMYTILFGLNRLLHPLMPRDFQMIAFYEKTD